MNNSAKNRAKIHEQVRRQHSSELAQDYVEAIYEIEETGVPVTVSSLQEIFGVSHVTVIRTLQRLLDQGLVTDTRSKKIGLSENGRHLAKSSAAKHALVKKLLIAIGVSEAQADVDAEGAEHHMSKETLEAIRHFLEKLEK